MRDVDELAASGLWPLGVQPDGQPLGRVLAAAATRVLLVEVACVPSGTLLGEVQAYMKVRVWASLGCVRSKAVRVCVGGGGAWALYMRIRDDV